MADRARQRPRARHDLTAVALGRPVLAPFRAELMHWLKKHGADAVLVRPDRYVFGTGDAQTLAQSWAALTANLGG